MADAELTNDPLSPAETVEAPKPKQPRDEHGHFAPKEGGKSKPAGKRSSKRATQEELSLEELREMLSDQVKYAAPLVMLPTASLVWEQRAPEAVENLVTLARRFPTMRTGLELGVVVFAGVGLVNFTSAVAYAGACDLGFANPDAIAAQSMGITDAYYRAHPEEEETRGAPDDHGSEPGASVSENGRGGLPVPSILGDVPREPR